MKKIFFFMVASLPVLLLQAQTLRRPVASGNVGLGAYSNSKLDVFSFAVNQAALANINRFSCGVYGERRFLLNELSLYTIAFALPTNSGTFGIIGSYSGFTIYNETHAGLAYGKKLGGLIDIGAQFNYNGITAAGYGNATAISFEGGIILHLTDKLNAGIHLYNPLGATYNKGENEKLPFVYSMVLGYELSSQFFIRTEIQKEEDQPVNVNVGLQYQFAPQLIAQGGIASATSSFWLGFGTSIKQLRVRVSADFHPQLGVTTGIQFIYVANSSNNE